MKKRTKQRTIVRFSARVEVVKLVKVRSYKRIRNGLQGLGIISRRAQSRSKSSKRRFEKTWSNDP